MPESAQGVHGIATPHHTLAPRLIRRVIVGQHVAAPAASITFDTIPPYFTNLVLRLTAVSNDTTGTTTDLNLTVNDDNGSNMYGYAETHYTGSVSGSASTGATIAIIGKIPTQGTGTVAGRPGSLKLTLFGIASTVWQKQWVSHDFCQPTTTNSFVYFRGGAYRSADPVRRFTLSCAAGSFIQDSMFDLYGEP
jgi:hypothetical protein